MSIDKMRLQYFLELSARAYYQLVPLRKDEKIFIINDSETDVQAYILTEKDTVTIVFRGSNSKKDWITNFTIAHKTIPYNNSETKIRVHSGFMQAYSSKNVRNIIHTFITPEIKHIITVGHSYGAALAQLCAVDMQYNFPECDIESYQFGCPRIGNSAYSRSYNRRVFNSFRIVNGNDAVTKVPPFLLGFRHTGIKIHIGFMNIPLILSFSNHRPSSYYENLIKTNI